MAGDLKDAIIHDKEHVVCNFRSDYCGEGPKRHQHASVTVKAYHCPVRTSECNAKRKVGGMAHGAIG
jgi:hypothetical protein